MKNARAQRGFTIIEALVALVLMMFGVLGLAGLQVVGVRANHFGKRMAEASALALDLEEQIGQWAYGDPRLASVATLSGPADPNIRPWDLGRDQTMSSVPATSHPEFSDLAGDPANPTGGSGQLASNYQGIQSDLTGGGSPDYVRYWTAYTYNDGTSNGKLIQIFVRWKEPSLGYRQIKSIAFKTNPAGFQGV